MENYSVELKAVAEKYRTAMIFELKKFLEEAKEEGNLRGNLNLKLISQIIVFLFEEGLRNKRFSRISNRADFVREVSELIFYGILKKTEE
jgi:hypothetical protein